MKNEKVIRKAFVITTEPEMLSTYIARHNPIWPELKEVLKAHGVQNYSIFSNPESSDLFGYFEIADEDLFNKLSENEVCRKWWIYMAEVLVCEHVNSKKGKEITLTEIFHLS